MVSRDLTPIGGEFGTREPVTSSELNDGLEVTKHAYLPIFDREGTKTKFLHLGYGIPDADKRVGRHALDLKLIDGSGAVVDAQGSVRFAVYPDSDLDEPKATGDKFTASELRDQTALNARDREMFPAMKPGARDDEVVVAEYEAAPGETGYTVSAADSSSEFHVTKRSIDR